jgi:hypothetical protein
VARVSAVAASILLLNSLLLMVFSTILASLLLLPSADVPVVSCADVGPAVADFLRLLFHPWDPCYGKRPCCSAVPTAVDVSFATGVSNASDDPLLLASLVLLAFLLLLDPCRAVCVPAVAGVHVVANVPAVATFLPCWRSGCFYSPWSC